jgi:peptidoglycan/xylan/chitin deacetylase (PgdA/CDA1 family)
VLTVRHRTYLVVALGVLGIAVSSTVASACGARAAAEPADTPVPILMYHVLGDPPAGAPYPDLYVRASDFAGQMRRLERDGFQAVTLRRVWDHWRHGAPLPRKPIVVSFDDGYRSTAEVALPVLRERGWPGILNLKVLSLERTWGIRPRQVRALVRAGWEIDAHTITHPDLTAVDDRRLALEVAGSRREIRSAFGVPVDFFCYPAGQYDERVIAAVRRAGYLGATTTIEGLARQDRPFELRRVRVGREDGVAGLVSTLERLLSRSA